MCPLSFVTGGDRTMFYFGPPANPIRWIEYNDIA